MPPARIDSDQQVTHRRADPLVTRPFLLLLCAQFLQALGWSSILLLPLYLDHLGASRTQVGVIMASAAVGGLLFRPLIGWSLDTLGRKPTIVAGTLLLAAGMGTVYFVREIGPMVYVHRALFGIGIGALFTGYFTFATDIIPRRRRAEGIALFGVAGLLPLTLNPIVDRLGLEPAQLRSIFPLVGVLILLSLVALLNVPEPKRAALVEPVRLRPVIRALRRPPLWPVWLATVVFSAVLATFMAFVTVVAANRGIPRPAVIWFAYAGGAIFVRVFGGRFPDRVGTYNLVVPALATYAAAALLIASSWSESGFLMAGLLGGIGHGYTFPVLTAQVVNRSPEHLRGTSLAMFTALWEVSTLLLTPLFGRLADAYDDATMLSSVACLTAFALAGWAILEHRHGQPDDVGYSPPSEAPITRDLPAAPTPSRVTSESTTMAP